MKYFKKINRRFSAVCSAKLRTGARLVAPADTLRGGGHPGGPQDRTGVSVPTAAPQPRPFDGCIVFHRPASLSSMEPFFVTEPPGLVPLYSFNDNGLFRTHARLLGQAEGQTHFHPSRLSPSPGSLCVLRPPSSWTHLGAPCLAQTSRHPPPAPNSSSLQPWLWAEGQTASGVFSVCQLPVALTLRAAPSVTRSKQTHAHKPTTCSEPQARLRVLINQPFAGSQTRGLSSPSGLWANKSSWASGARSRGAGGTQEGPPLPRVVGLHSSQAAKAQARGPGPGSPFLLPLPSSAFSLIGDLAPQ